MATNAYDIVKRPVITEQSMEQSEMKRYTFEVAKSANKIEIAKAAEGNVIVVDGLNLDAIKTKSMKAFLDSVQAGKAVLVTPEVNENVVKSARNIPGVMTTTAKILSVYDIVNANQFIVDKAALAVIEEVFA